MLLADHLMVLNAGKVVQAGAPLDLYRRPASSFVASFLGEANLLEAVVTEGDRRIKTPFGHFPAGDGQPRGVLLVRPEDVTEDPRGTVATVVDSRGLGPYDRVVLLLDGGTEVLAHLPPETAPPPGTRLRVSVRTRAPHFLS